MVETNYKFLEFIKFKSIEKWGINQLIRIERANSKHSLNKIGVVIKRNKNQIIIKDDITYKRITIRMDGNGVVLRDCEIGKKIRTKKQFMISKGQLAISKIDARNGAIGIVPKEVDGAVITGNFWVYDVDDKMANINYLIKVLTSKQFVKIWLECSHGGGNRLYLQEKLFLDSKIPIPNIDIQNQIIDRYNSTINKADENEKIAMHLEESIDKILFDELGIEEIEEGIKSKQNYKHLKLLSFSNMNQRWELDEKSEKVIERLESGYYKVDTLHNITKFITRPWKKTEHKSKTFNYIEIGGIDEELGIVKTRELPIDEAPSRATQIVRTGDLIIGMTRPYLKKFAIVGQEYDGFVCTSGFQVVEKSDSYNLEYIINLIKSELIIKQFEIAMTDTLYPAINQGQLKEILIPIPPLETQKVIANKVFDIKQKIKSLRQESKYLKEKANNDFEQEVFGES